MATVSGQSYMAILSNTCYATNTVHMQIQFEISYTDENKTKESTKERHRLDDLPATMQSIGRHA